MLDFQKTLIANRGEISIGVMRAANKLGKQTAAVFTNEYKISLHLFNADAAYKIRDGLGPAAVFLDINKILPTYRKFHLR